jgi:hypothetical protein
MRVYNQNNITPDSIRLTQYNAKIKVAGASSVKLDK